VVISYCARGLPRKEQQRQGAAEEQARIWLAELPGSEQAPTVSQLAVADILLLVEGQRLQPHQWNVQLHCPATTPATPAPADLTLTKDVQYSLAPDERFIHELLKPTRPI
jgi:hypothetical protein